ncbi:MAG: penicillin-binding protein 2 [Candidatus Nealsonbacteria bacterium]
MFKFRPLKQSEDIEPNEILLDSFIKRQEGETGIAEKKLEVPLVRIILQIFFVVCFLVIILLFVKTAHLQVVLGQEYSRLSRQNNFIISQIQAERGVIYDKNGKQLVFNQSNFNLVLQKSKLPEGGIDRVLAELSGIIREDIGEIKEKIEGESGDMVLISGNLDHQALILLETRIGDLEGFSIKNNTIRSYSEGDLFSHIIGYTGRIRSEEVEADPEFYTVSDYVGRSGIENYYENVLRKNPGQLRTERDALNNVISQEVISLSESGESLVLWLDSDLQAKIESELKAALSSIGSKKAAVVALDPKTGGVLSLVSFPSFDNNLFERGADSKALSDLLSDKSGTQPLFNRAISGGYSTGSIIKPLIASGALEEKIISPDKKLNCKGSITIPNEYNPEIEYIFRDVHVHGSTDLKKAIAESCNVYFFTVGGGYGSQEGLGPTRIKQYLELFGWGEKTGIDLPGERSGFIPDKNWKSETLKEGWWDGDTYNLSIGQGYISITPLEVANAFSSIANGGTLLKPQIVKGIVSNSSGGLETVKEIGREVLNEDFIDQANLEIVREGMRQTVTGKNSPLATALDLNYLPVSAAAKTGTAETSKTDYYHNWITVFAPYDDPEIVLTIMIEDVKGVQRTVTPLAFNILNWYFSR